jgi:parallel beta-helix repeat protein
MIKKYLAVGIILLFVGTCIIPTTAQNIEKPLTTSRGNWLYVGGSGPGNYSKIQEAIDDSSPGDTIYVYNGTYYEHIIINKTIHLMGEEKNITTIDGIEYYLGTVYIKADGVILSGFILRNGGTGVRINNNDTAEKIKNICVYDNIITLNNFGLSLNDCVNALIDNNIIRDNNLQGISIYRAQNITYTRNIIKNNYHGFTCSEGELQRIERNIIEDNDIGILLFSGKNNSYIGNIIRNNNIGILNDGPMPGEMPDLQTIERNTIENNENGITYQLNSQTRVLSNNFINNEIDSSMASPGFNLAFQMSDFLQFLLGSHKTKWDGNYWDTWHKTTPKPIGGFFLITFAIAITHDFGIWIPLGIYPYIKFDRHPAQDPYDISERDEKTPSEII